MMTDFSASSPDRGSVAEILQHGTFEDALAALESVVSHLERGQLAIDEAVDWYDVGLSLARRCSAMLQQAELRISRLDEVYDVDGIGDTADPDGF